MSGQAADSKCHTLKIGDACIIEVDRVNSPTGLWWGRVTEIGGPSGCWQVRAVIDGGRFAHVTTGAFPEKLRSDERHGVEPSVNYCVYADTPSIRELLSRLESLENQVRLGQDRFKMFRDDTAAMLGQAIRAAKPSQG